MRIGIELGLVSRVAAVLLVAVGIASPQTRQFLDAPVVKSQIVVRWNASTKTMQWAIDDNPKYLNIGPDTVFLAKQGIYVTYPRLNPLRVQATSSVTAVADPAFAAVTKLIEAITSVATTVAPGSVVAGAAPAAPRAPCSDAQADITDLVDLLYGPSGQPGQPDALKTAAKEWIKAIDARYSKGQSGPDAIGGVVEDEKAGIRAEAKTVGDIAAKAKKLLDAFQKCAASVGGPYERSLKWLVLSNPSERVQQLADISAALTKLADTLTSQYVDETKWMGTNNTNYILGNEIDATAEKMQNVTVKVVNIAFTVSSSSITTDQPAAGSATFSVRRYSALTPEVGVGVVFGTITQPVFGTAQNAAKQTIVARKPDKSVSVNPTVLVNFVCRCGSGLLTPMAQIGAAASKDVPAILLGAGLRLFGLSKGDVAIGGGAMFAWVKDLQKLHVGDVVTGTNDINSDLGFSSRPRVGGYFAIQYKF